MAGTSPAEHRDDLLNASELLVVLVVNRPLSEGDAVTTTPDSQLKPGVHPHLAKGNWRVDPADSHASFTARLAGRRVRGQLPLTGQVLITDPIEESAARLTARTSAVSTGSPVLDRLVAGPAFLDARAYPEITFQSDLLVWVPAGWRAVGRLHVKNAEHELACEFGVHLGDARPGGTSRLVIACTWVIDSTWVTSQRIPGLGRRIAMTCSFDLDPDM
jgi:polyisoprenoid-binding protein YceI